MAIIDAFNMLADASAMPLSQTTAVVGTVLDFGSVGNKDAFGEAILRNINEGGRNAWNMICEDEDFASSGSPVITYYLVTADNDVLTSNAVVLDEVADDTQYKDGEQILRRPLPAGRVGKRYLGILAKVGTADLTAGKITAWLGQLNDDNAEK